MRGQKLNKIRSGEFIGEMSLMRALRPKKKAGRLTRVHHFLSLT